MDVLNDDWNEVSLAEEKCLSQHSKAYKNWKEKGQSFKWFDSKKL